MNNKEMNYVVTYWDKDTEPVITVFDNFDAAEKCFKYFKKLHDGCCLDHCKVYSNFSIQ